MILLPYLGRGSFEMPDPIEVLPNEIWTICMEMDFIMHSESGQKAARSEVALLLD